MKIVRNNIIPFKGFEALNLFGVLFVRKDRVFENEAAWQVMIRHESIHTKQMQELGSFHYSLFIIHCSRDFRNRNPSLPASFHT